MGVNEDDAAADDDDADAVAAVVAVADADDDGKDDVKGWLGWLQASLMIQVFEQVFSVAAVIFVAVAHDVPDEVSDERVNYSWMMTKQRWSYFAFDTLQRMVKMKKKFQWSVAWNSFLSSSSQKRSYISAELRVQIRREE